MIDWLALCAYALGSFGIGYALGHRSGLRRGGVRQQYTGRTGL